MANMTNEVSTVVYVPQVINEVKDDSLRVSECEPILVESISGLVSGPETSFDRGVNVGEQIGGLLNKSWE